MNLRTPNHFFQGLSEHAMSWRTRGGRAGALLGMELGGGVCRYVVGKKTSEGIWQVEQKHTLEIPEKLTEAVPLLRARLQRDGCLGLRTAFSLAEATHIRRLELPKMPAEDLREAIRWQMRDVAEASIDDYVVRYTLLRELTGEPPRLELLGFAVQRTLLEEKKGALSQIGLKPVFLEPLPVSVAAIVDHAYPGSGEEWCAILSLHKSLAYFLVLGRGRLYFAKPIPVLSEAEAARLGDEFLTKAAVEVQTALDAFVLLHPEEKLQRLFLVGEPGLLAPLSPYLTKTVGIAAEPFDPWVGFQTTAQTQTGNYAIPLAMLLAGDVAQKGEPS